jgi:hypothetical protein
VSEQFILSQPCNLFNLLINHKILAYINSFSGLTVRSVVLWTSHWSDWRQCKKTKRPLGNDVCEEAIEYGEHSPAASTPQNSVVEHSFAMHAQLAKHFTWRPSFDLADVRPLYRLQWVVC